jgi:asparaginyl-tRNA synthetase
MFIFPEVHTSKMKEILAHMKRSEVKDIVHIQTEALWKIHETFTKKGFKQLMPLILSPITDPLGPDPGSSVIKTGKIEYQGQELQLTQSMILHKQLALIAGLEKLYIASPNVRLERAERKETGKHAFEFTQLDFEIAHGTMDDVFMLTEDVLTDVIRHVKESCGEELKRLGRRLRVPSVPFKRYTTHELEECYGKDWELKASMDHKEPFWVLCHKREFYDREDPERPGHYRNYDLIYPEGFGEALSGGEREHEYRRISERIKKDRLDVSMYRPFLELAKKGLLVPSAGAGFGIERLVRFLSDRDHIRKVQLFPRIPGERVIV